MLITIIIPIYKVEEYIEDCIKSVMSQTYQGGIECILVNDCTPDNSCLIAEQIIANCRGNIDFKILHHEQNRGLSAARNTGLDAASGEYVYFLDSDDEITSNCIETLTEPLKNRSYDFIIGDYITTGEKRYSPPLKMDEGEYLTNGIIRTAYFKEEWYPMGVNKLCKTSFLRENNLFFKEGLIHEDELWSFQLACVTQSIFVTKEICYNYKMREQSIMGYAQSKRSLESKIRIIAEMIDFASEKGILDKDIYIQVLRNKFKWIKGIFECDNDELKYFLVVMKRSFKFNPSILYLKGEIPFKLLVKYFFLLLPGQLSMQYIRMYHGLRTFIKSE